MESSTINVKKLYGYKKYVFDFEYPESYSKLGFCNSASTCGHAFEKGRIWSTKKNLYALFVYNGRIFFKSNENVFDVTDSDWRAAREKISFFRFRFFILKGAERVFFTDYIDFPPSDIEEPDPHFFVNVIQWLANDKTKAGYLSYWNKVTRV